MPAETTHPTRTVVVIGHTNPDTDSICSAIAYAELKNKTGALRCEARRAGKLNRETQYVLRRFGVEPPGMCTDLHPTVRNVSYRKTPGVSREISMRQAWETMRDQQVDTLAVIGARRELEGLITVKGIATANMDVFDDTILAKSRTSYRNICATMKATTVIGDAEGVCDSGSRVIIGTDSPEVLETTLRSGDIVILSNRYESQLCAVEMGVSLMIVCGGATVGRTVRKLAEDNGVRIMTTPYDTYAAGKLISQCAPIGYYMTREGLQKFTLFTPVSDVISTMTRVRHREFPVMDEEGKYCGMLSRADILGLNRRQVILVDHNERTQAVEGLEHAEILEIIDHHRIGNVETVGPAFFRNQPIGSTATIVAQMYEEQSVAISPAMAGLLLSAILSDTLKFTSPTCTTLDEGIARRLAIIAGVEVDPYAAEMFEAGEQLEGKTAEDVFMQDFKVFMCGDVRFGVAQGNYLTESNLLAAEALLTAYLPEALRRQNLEDLFVLLTDISRRESRVLCIGIHAAEMLRTAFGREIQGGDAILPGVVSRKKQFIPKIMEAYQQL